MNFFSKMLLHAVLRATILSVAQASAQMPPAISGRGGTEIITLHAAGAQIYDCKPDAGQKAERGALTWQFREPIATLIFDGKSVGRHYAGPNWDHIDGSGVKGRVVASSPGATSSDIPSLELEVVEHRGNGILSVTTAVRRINTKGGVAKGSCESAGSYLSVPYSADYVFLRGGT
jgi:hypothetical protein